MKRSLLKSALALAVSAALFSGAALADRLQIKEGHPERYTVVKGDTLWDISGRFLQHPWQWPQIWGQNPQIKDPHWIYPGDVIELVYIDGKPMLRKASASGRVKLSPSMRMTDVTKPVQTVPMEEIASVLNAGYVTNDTDSFSSLPQVVDLHSERGFLKTDPSIVKYGAERRLGGQDQMAFVKGDVIEKGIYDVIRLGDEIIDYDSTNVLGTKVIRVGTVVIGGDVEGDVHSATIVKTHSDIRLGDRLSPNQAVDTVKTLIPKASSVEDGYVVGFTKEGWLQAVNDTVIINKGMADGVEVGSVFAIKRDGRTVKSGADDVTLPEEQVGVAMVYKRFDNVSYALLMDSTRSIKVGDNLRSPE